MKKNTTVIAIGIMLLACAGCYKDPANYKELPLLDVAPATDSVEADGATELLLYAHLYRDANKRTVTYATMHGRFADSSSTYTTEAVLENGDLSAIAHLVPGIDVLSNVNIRITSSGITKNIFVNFVKALPDNINVESATATIEKKFGSEVPVEAHLLRNIGTPSRNQKVNFMAIKDNDSAIGDFRSVDLSGSNETGVVKAIFVLKDTSYAGRIRIIGTCEAKAHQLSDTFSVFVTQ